MGSWWLFGVCNRKSVMGVIGLIDGMVWFHRELVVIIIARDQMV